MLDIESAPELVAYLRRHAHILENETPQVRVLHGGVSNKTVWVRKANGDEWVLKQALAKLRVKADWFSDPARVHREAAGMQALAHLAPSGTITPLVFEDAEHHIIAMQAVAQPHENWKSMLLRGDVQDDHIRQFGTLLGHIHTNSLRRAPLAAQFADRSFFESLRLEPYYAYTAERVPHAAPFIHSLVHQTRQTQTALVHGDYSPKNILVWQNKLILLDHEVIHFGDPAFDVGFSMTHLLSKAHHLVAHRAAFIRAAQLYWQTYFSVFGDVDAAHENRAVQHTLACLLARVAGRSPLEYLDAPAQARQQALVLNLMRQTHTQNKMPDFIRAFATEL